MGFFARLFKRKKSVAVGLALGSGGAKGMAHLGALKAFEEAGVSFDIITGTSIGSIVGALYAKGYTSADMTGIIESLNRNEFARNLRPFADLDFAEEFLSQYLEGDFTRLKKPFACWATDGATNEGVLLNSGSLARCITASSAIPPFFRAVEMGGRKLYDGAYTNAIPADVCRDMGADVVIAIDLSAYVKTDEEKGKISRFFGNAINAFIPVKVLDDAKTRGYEAADVMLRPNLYGYRATDVSRADMDAMLELGYNEASAHMDEVKEAIANAGKKRKTDKKQKKGKE